MEFIGEISALATAILWSLSSFIFTYVSMEVGAIKLNISRMFIACILLLLTILIFGIDYQMTLNNFLLLSASGLIGLVIGDSFLYKSFGMVGPRISLLVMSSNPIVASIAAYFIMGEVISSWGIFGMSLTITGIILVVSERKSGNNKFKISAKGVIYSFIAAIGQGIGLIFAKIAIIDGEIHGMTASFVRLLAAVVIMFMIFPFFKNSENSSRGSIFDKKILGLLISGSIIGPFLGITLSLVAVKHALVGIASTLMGTIPVIMLPLSVWIYKEKLSWQSVSGAFIAVIGVAILFLK